MIVHLYDYNLRRRVPHTIPEAQVTELLHVLLETDRWRERPADMTVEYLMKWRRETIKQAERVPAEPEVGVPYAVPSEPVSWTPEAVGPDPAPKRRAKAAR